MMSPFISFSTRFIFSISLISIVSSCGEKGTKLNEIESKESKSEEITSIIERINEQGKLYVGLEPDAPPIYFENEGKKMGFDYQLIEFIAKEVFENVDIETKEEGYDKLPELLENKTIQIMAGGRTNEEKTNEKYTDSYLSFGFCILTKKTNTKKYVDLKSISDASIGVYDDYAAEWIKERAPRAKIIILGDREDENTPESDWMSALVKGEVDVIIYDYPFASNEIADYNDKIKITSKNINDSEMNEYVLVVNAEEPGADELVDEINKAIKKYKQSSLYSDAIAQYIPNTGSPTGEIQDSKNAYVIQRGETLSIIARDHLGDPSRWNEIYELNRNRLASADIIYPGQQLVKVDGWR